MRCALLLTVLSAAACGQPTVPLTDVYPAHWVDTVVGLYEAHPDVHPWTAASHGVELAATWNSEREEGRMAFYQTGAERVVLTSNLGPNLFAYALAHELTHAYVDTQDLMEVRDDDCSGYNGPDSWCHQMPFNQRTMTDVAAALWDVPPEQWGEVRLNDVKSVRGHVPHAHTADCVEHGGTQ